jgi:hypothetical protein
VCIELRFEMLAVWAAFKAAQSELTPRRPSRTRRKLEPRDARDSVERSEMFLRDGHAVERRQPVPADEAQGRVRPAVWPPLCVSFMFTYRLLAAALSAERLTALGSLNQMGKTVSPLRC